MGKFFLTLLGCGLGIALAYVNRPKMLGGLVDPVRDSLTGPGVDRAAMNDWFPMLLTYGAIGAAIGFVVGLLVDSRRKDYGDRQ